MEEQIKALIEKYEGQQGDWERLIEKHKGEGKMEHYYQGLFDETENFLYDLKQLLTTSQGNPERMV